MSAVRPIPRSCGRRSFTIELCSTSFSYLQRKSSPASEPNLASRCTHDPPDERRATRKYGDHGGSCNLVEQVGGNFSPGGPARAGGDQNRRRDQNTHKGRQAACVTIYPGGGHRLSLTLGRGAKKLCRQSPRCCTRRR